MKKTVNILDLQAVKREAAKDDKQVAFKYQVVNDNEIIKSKIYLGFLTILNVLIRHWGIFESKDLLPISYLEIKNQLSYRIRNGSDIEDIEIAFSLNNPHLNREYLKINDVGQSFEIEL